MQFFFIEYHDIVELFCLSLYLFELQHEVVFFEMEFSLILFQYNTHHIEFFLRFLYSITMN